jgi:NitT/TauT family transport system ATP-binding protein
MKVTQVRCGYLPLVDCAPLIIAKELTFAAQEGLDLDLHKQPSWSALRDMLAFGQVDFGHMLSPMPVAMSLGLGSAAFRVDALMILSVNGTVIGVSQDLNAKMRALGWDNSFEHPQTTSQTVFRASTDVVRIGVPFPFSMHRMLVETWLQNCPSFSHSRIKIVTVPPPQMAQAVKSGLIDMFCVGEPWGSVAVQQADATLILPGSQIWQFVPEKVLGVRHIWAEQNKDICHALVRAIYKAAHWLDQPENTQLAVEILAKSQHLDLATDMIEPALTRWIVTGSGQTAKQVDRFMNFHNGAANFPWRSQAMWIANKIVSWHDLDLTASHEIARKCFRSDIYRSALTPIGADLPSASEKIEGAMSVPTAVASTMGEMILGPDRFFNGAVFDFGEDVQLKI